MNQTVAYETTKGTDPDTATDPGTATATDTTAANILNQIALTFRVDELINRRITSARAKRRVSGNVDHF